MRIFVGIDLEKEVRARIESFIAGVQGFVPDARWMRSDSFHVTLKFIGEQSPEMVEAITACLRQVDSTGFGIRFGGYGFFPNAKAPRVFWIGIHGGPQLSELVENVDAAAGELGIPLEDRAYSPHLTLARGGAGRRSGSPKPVKGNGPNAIFAKLQKKLNALNETDFGTMTVREFILYQSQLSPKGSTYTKLQRFQLRSV
jgi:2'-5' RNA ligase